MNAYSCLAADIGRGRRENRTNAIALPALIPGAVVFALLTTFIAQSYANSPQNDPETNAPLIRPATSIIALLLFLCTLSGKRQFHASQDKSRRGSRIAFD
jgi:hypothetical protein